MKTITKVDLVRRFKAPGWQMQAQLLELHAMAVGHEELIEVDRHSRLYVPVGEALERRVAQAYHEVWLSLPVSARRRLQTFWRAQLHGHLPGAVIVEFAGNAAALAATSGGTSIVFNTGLTATLPFTVLRDVVAHEFGHMWNRTFPDSVLSQHFNDAAYLAEKEWEADVTAEYWGRRLRNPFSMSRWREWCESNPKLVQENLGQQWQWILPAFSLNKCQIKHPSERRLDDPF